jgi:isopentenyl diphosphate isomerase/L-lactate dehydrogenase-like FMN-dependent dehydrogenase
MEPAVNSPPAPTLAATDYWQGAAGDERTMARNITAFDRCVLVPRVLRGVTEVDLRTTVTGGEIGAPLLVAPMGLQALVHPDGEAAAATAAATAGVGFCLSTFSSCDPADAVARAGAGLRWFQLYLMRDPEITGQLVSCAERLSFDAIVCTLDVPVVGRRNRDRVYGFDRFTAAPPALVRAPWFEAIAADRGLSPKALLDDVFPHPGCTWDELAATIASTHLPVLVKGVLHPDDACRAVRLGAAGIVVSNHGGRQFDRSVSSVEALAGVHAAVGEVVPVYLDSGVRAPAHVAMALCLGARAVLVGRPVLAALAEGGETGVVALLHRFVDELGHIMRIVGAATTGELTGVQVLRA